MITKVSTVDCSNQNTCRVFLKLQGFYQSQTQFVLQLGFCLIYHWEAIKKTSTKFVPLKTLNTLKIPQNPQIPFNPLKSLKFLNDPLNLLKSPKIKISQLPLNSLKIPQNTLTFLHSLKTPHNP